MSRYEMRIQAPSQIARETGIDYDLFTVWDTETNRRVPFGNYRKRERALTRIQRMEEK